MFKLLFLMFQLLGCQTVLQIDDTDSAEPEIVMGINSADDCAQWIGRTICNLILWDHDNILWELYDYEEDVILLDLSAMWCGPCQSAAATVQSTQDDYESRGFRYVTILLEDLTRDTVEIEEIELWRETFGIETATVLQGSRDLIDYSATGGFPLTAWPMFILVDRDLTIYWGMYGFNEEMLRESIEEIL
jgi:thiol-disulfide isomerase/thioredoxin